MHPSPAEEWNRLTRLYSEMSDGQLEELAADFSNLTEIAHSVLRDELKKRALNQPPSPVVAHEDRSPGIGGLPDCSRFSAVDVQAEAQDEPVEYTWKTVLCECGDWNQAWNISDALRREGIASWTEGPRRFYESGLIRPRVLVPADQLEEARVIASKPVPQEVIDLHREFVPSRCPKCGAEDPVLEDSEPANHWHCDECGADWTDVTTLDNTSSASQQ